MTDSVSGNQQPLPVQIPSEQMKPEGVEPSSPGFENKNSVSYKSTDSSAPQYLNSEEPPTLPEPKLMSPPSESELESMQEQSLVSQTKGKLLSSLNQLQGNKNISISPEFAEDIYTLNDQLDTPGYLDKSSIEKAVKLADRLYDTVFSESLDAGKLHEIMVNLQNQIQDNSAKYSELVLKIKATEDTSIQAAKESASLQESNDRAAKEDVRFNGVQTAADRKKKRKSQRADRIEERRSQRAERMVERQEKRAERVAERQSRRSARMQARIDRIRERNPKRAARMQERLDNRTERQSDRAKKVKKRQSDRADEREDKLSDRLERLREWNPDRAERIQERQEKRAERLRERQDDRRKKRLERAEEIREKNPDKADRIEARVAKRKERQKARAQRVEERQEQRRERIRDKQAKQTEAAERKAEAANTLLSVVMPKISDAVDTKQTGMNHTAAQAIQGIQTAQEGLSQIDMMKILLQLQRESENQEELEAAIRALEAGDPVLARDVIAKYSTEQVQAALDGHNDFVVRLAEIPQQLAESQALSIANENLIQRNSRV